ncbi:spore germination protein (amino acid permease) [Bhargavaea cecembensis DSE10]|uniref:Spore germination protein (Amino acid permease) n=1 Tax=Bhargavaea cecembensis DSE10 TaxID=1235279 RepID=M7NYN9_9BACL|nr:GerAB/ArcD/ProY family transporter [Bhargavaea cecembensis]EMR06760.1 spore germination protein (amino acid permease) [Bhargavaea cecembensis DSE10]
MKLHITSLQLFLMLFIAMTGTVFVSFQSLMVNAVGRDAWWLFLAQGLLILPHLWLFNRFYQDFKWSGPIAFLYGVYWFLVMASFLGYIGYTLNVWAYPKTPAIVIMALVVIVLFYMMSSRDETTVNIGVILIPMILLFMLFVYMGINHAVWTNLFPVGEASLQELQRGSIKAQLPFIGIELFLLLRTFVPGKLSTWKLAVYSGIWLLFFLQMLIIPMVYFALEEFKLISEPIMYMLKSQDVAFMERLDLLFVYIWLAWSFVAMGIYAFSVMRLLPEKIKKRRTRNAAVFCILLLAVGSRLATKETVRLSGSLLLYAHLFFAVALPFLVIMVNRVFGKKRGGKPA